MLSREEIDIQSRQRLLEGVLLRLSRRPLATALVLRGGMLLRHWFRPRTRWADDLDMIALTPSDSQLLTEEFGAILAEPCDDGVTYHSDAIYGVSIKFDTGTPGVRMFASGVNEDEEVDFHIDITFGPAPRPGHMPIEFPTSCGLVAPVLACRPEAVLGQKVQALCHLGLLGWRPKDLSDLVSLLRSVQYSPDDLRVAVQSYLGDVRRTGLDLTEAVGPDGWLRTKFAAARWLDFLRDTRSIAIESDLSAVAAGVAQHLLPISK